jgi:hypothetical protein
VAKEATRDQHEVAEAALAYVIADRTEAACRRGDLFDKRRRLMAAWAAYCQSRNDSGGAVISIKSNKQASLGTALKAI